MTERGRSAVARDASSLAIGPSSMLWSDDGLVIDIDETSAPVPSRLKGRIRLQPLALTSRSVALDSAGKHHWWPIAPRARIEIAFAEPSLSWSGMGYLDTNTGEEPLEAAFTRWDWSRANIPDGAAVLYNVRQRSGADLSLALRFDPAGGTEDFEPPPATPLPSTLWRVLRETQADDRDARVARTLEDTPFYARSVLSTKVLGQTVTAMHESVSLDRFKNPVVRAMLPFRMPRALW